jgi:diacylglycerol O-acyltransferase
MVPLASNQALGIAIMSYDGHMFFGLGADYDTLPDLEDLADDLRISLAELVAAAGVSPRDAERRGRTRTRG